MILNDRRTQISEFLGFHALAGAVTFTTHAVTQAEGYTRARISYPDDEGAAIPAFLLLPEASHPRPYPAVLVHHQHNGERHLGKSEVCGLAGDPLQAFGPALARRGMVVLAPDSICFEDRRRTASGIEPDALDVAQHYNELCYRLLRGDTLMRKVLADSARAVSLLKQHPLVDPGRIGMLGHSYGGSTTLFHAPLDGRVRFACSSGAAASLAYRMTHELGIEMSQVVPGLATRYDLADLVACMAPRPMLVLSATEDKHAMDAERIVAAAQEICRASGTKMDLTHRRYQGGHSLTQERFEFVLEWLHGRSTQATGMVPD